MPSAQPSFKLRRALLADVPAIQSLIDLSVRSLQAEDYSPKQIEGALGTVFGVDTQLIADGTYFVVEAHGENRVAMAGCGGWSRRKTLFGSDRMSVNPGARREDDLLDPVTDRAKIRAFFVHPDWVRRGVGTMILDASEQAAATAGFAAFELGATLTGERLYRTRGYREIDRIEVRLSNGASLPIVRMWKPAPDQTARIEG